MFNTFLIVDHSKAIGSLVVVPAAGVMALVILGQSIMLSQVNKKVRHFMNIFYVSLWGWICF
jgi:hypothetical protein